MECWTWTSRDLWRTIFKQIGIWSRRYIVKVTQICQCWVVKTPVFLIAHRAWIMWCKSIARHLCSFGTIGCTKITEMQKQWTKLKLNIICSWWSSFVATIDKGILSLSKWLGFWHFHYRQWGGHVIHVWALPICILQCSLDSKYLWYVYNLL